MPTTNVTLMCPICRQPTVHTQETSNVALHVILSILTLGFWLIVWLVIALISPKPQCTACAARAATTAPGAGGPTAATALPPPTSIEMCVKHVRKTPHGIGPSGEPECLECLAAKLGPAAVAPPPPPQPAPAPAAQATHKMHCTRCNRETLHDLIPGGGVKCQRCAILDEDAAERAAKP